MEINITKQAENFITSTQELSNKSINNESFIVQVIVLFSFV